MYAKYPAFGETGLKHNGNLLDPEDIGLFSHQESQQSFSSGQSIYDEQGYYSQPDPHSMVYSDYYSPLPDSSTTFEESANADRYEPYECVPSQTENYESNPRCYCPDCVKPTSATPSEQPSCSYPVESPPSLPGLYPSGAGATYIYDEAGVKYEIRKCDTLNGQAQTSTENSPAAYSPVAMMSAVAMPTVMDYRAQRRIPNNPPRAMRMNIPCHVNSKCANCGTTETTLWRRGVNGEVECNACNLFYRKNQRNRPLAMHKKQIKKRKRQPRVFSY